MKTYFIHKASRLPESPYAGPSCDTAGIPKGQLYINLVEALDHAAQLTAVNPVGFEVASLCPRVYPTGI